MKPYVEFEDLSKLDIKIGTIIEAQAVEGSEKLLRLTVDVGEIEPRIIFTGMAKWYKPEDLKGLQTIFLTNIKPRKMMGSESQGMIMAIDTPDGGKPMFLVPQIPVGNGDSVI